MSYFASFSTVSVSSSLFIVTYTVLDVYPWERYLMICGSCTILFFGLCSHMVLEVFPAYARTYNLRHNCPLNLSTNMLKIKTEKTVFENC